MKTDEKGGGCCCSYLEKGGRQEEGLGTGCLVSGAAAAPRSSRTSSSTSSSLQSSSRFDSLPPLDTWTLARIPRSARKGRASHGQKSRSLPSPRTCFPGMLPFLSPRPGGKFVRVCCIPSAARENMSGPASRTRAHQFPASCPTTRGVPEWEPALLVWAPGKARRARPALPETPQTRPPLKMTFSPCPATARGQKVRKGGGQEQGQGDQGDAEMPRGERSDCGSVCDTV